MKKELECGSMSLIQAIENCTPYTNDENSLYKLRKILNSNSTSSTELNEALFITIQNLSRGGCKGRCCNEPRVEVIQLLLASGAQIKMSDEISELMDDLKTSFTGKRPNWMQHQSMKEVYQALTITLCYALLGKPPSREHVGLKSITKAQSKPTRGGHNVTEVQPARTQTRA